jgi:hypothetical protein
MRPRGEIRVALFDAAQALKQEQGGATWREMAARACVGFDAARKTVSNMVLAGELEPCGQVRAAHACRPMVRYAPKRRGGWVSSGFGHLDAALRGWGR